MNLTFCEHGYMAGGCMTDTLCPHHGAITVQKNGQKFDSGKEPMVQGLLAYFGKALRAVAGISSYGKKKYSVEYSDQNWRKVDNAKGRYADALLRHLEAYSRGEMIDPESGKAHVDHMAWNALALSELEKSNWDAGT